MSNTFKIERARALNKAQGSPHKRVKLIPRGQPEGLRDTRTGQVHEHHVDNGGERHGNNRHMYAKLKVSKRRAERKRNNRDTTGEV